MKLGWTAALLVVLAGCATASRVVRLDTGQADTLVFTPRSGAEPVKLNGDEFKEAVAKRAWEVRPSTRPQEAARKLFEVETRSGSYTYETRSRRVTSLGPDEHLEGTPPVAEVELTRDYLRWCERTGRPGDCLRLLTESPVINGDGRFALALALAKGAVLDEMLEAFKDMADPHARVAAGLWTWTMYMVLISIPDVTVSKGLAAVMTATLISYVGVDTFWGLVVGFKRLMDEADRAATFNELREAGERYGKVMGRNAARAFAMLATVALGNTAPGLAAKVPTLPGAMQAAAQAETQVGLRLAAVGEVETVAVSAETITIALAPGAAAMSAQGSGATSAPLPASGDDISVKDAHVDVPKHNLDRLAPTWPEQRQFLIDTVRQLDGKVSALATTPQGSIFESTLKINDRFGGIANLTIRWFKYTDGRITINTAFIPP
ncbi:hypothetical protein [Archangium sp.]|uniref:SitA5 family polymorphic toxin n=1 Tax=Archangium sp. TaxID=1872627 RepID=UPI002D2FDCDC|nr:hypothetical protein [Archangium sp.]HYO52587.1 hypothetical protein [Archangium sp.]